MESIVLDVYRGDTFSRQFQFTEDGAPVVLPGSGWSAQLRAHPKSDAVLASFTVDATDASTGLISLSLPAAATAVLRNGSVWDLQHTDGVVVRTWARGRVRVTEDVTRSA